MFLVILGNKESLDRSDLDFIRRYNGDYGEQRSFYDYMFDTPFLIRQFTREILRTRGLILARHPFLLFYFLLIIAYVASPIDLVPEAIFGVFGYIDDLAFVLLFFIGIASSFLQILTH